MKLEKPLVFFDLETTGLNIATDRIISLALVRMEIDGSKQEFYSLFNPKMDIPAVVTELTGIDDTMVVDAPLLAERSIILAGLFAGADLAGYNCLNFDIPLLWEEFYRVGFTWDISSARAIDAGNIFKKKEARTLAAAVKFYTGIEMENAHNALADVTATINVLAGQMERYPDLAEMSAEKLAEFSRMDQRVDLAGKLVRNEAGEVCYNFGKSKGRRVVDDPGFGFWMLEKDFTHQTKMILSKLLNHNPEPEMFPV